MDANSPLMRRGLIAATALAIIVSPVRRSGHRTPRPGASMTCRTTHAITAVDMDEGSIFNSSVAAGHPPIGRPVESEPAHALVTGKVVIPQKPELPEVPVTG